MSEFIGSRISLISRSDIRYVGILHDINSENHTVALEQVVSHGTEGRREDPLSEIAGSDNVYEYIVFRGGDVKDLRIEETAPKPKPQQQVPDDPAILGSSAQRPPSYPQQPQQQPPIQYQQAPPTMPPGSQYYYPHPQQAGRYGPGPYQAPIYNQYPPSPGQPGMGQAPPANQQHQIQQQSPNQQQQPQQGGPAAQNRAPPQAPIGPAANRQQAQSIGQPQQGPVAQTSAQPNQAPISGDNSAAPTAAQRPAAEAQKPTTNSTQNKPDAVSVSVSPPVGPAQGNQSASKAPTGPKARGGIVPALPLPSPVRPTISHAQPAQQTTAGANAGTNPKPPASTISNDTTSAVQDLANKVNQLAMKAAAPGNNANTNGSTSTNANSSGFDARTSRQPGTGGFVANRGARGGYRGNFGNAANQQHVRKVEVPTTDYDFETANAKFNKKDLVKEVIAGDEENKPRPTAGSASTNGANAADTDGDDVEIPSPSSTAGFYNRGASFFDNISCENKERAEAKDGEKPRGGAAWRGEEQKRNLETFGQGSVDGGFGHYNRAGWRGRSRGRGFGRGRGGYSGGGGYPRGGVYRGHSQDGAVATGGN